MLKQLKRKTFKCGYCNEEVEYKIDNGRSRHDSHFYYGSCRKREENIKYALPKDRNGVVIE